MLKNHFYHNNKNYDIWELFNLISKKDFCELLRFYNNMKNSSNHISAMQSIFQIIIWKYRLKCILISLLNKKENHSQIIEFISDIKKSEDKDMYSEKIVRKELDYLDSCNDDKKNAVYILQHANEAIFLSRNQLTPIQIDLLVEFLFFGICFNDFEYFTNLKNKFLK